jgi:hypothetical protein
MFRVPKKCEIVGASTALVMLCCRPSLPPDIRSLRERTEPVELVLVGARGSLIDTRGGSKRLVIGPYELESRWTHVPGVPMSTLSVTVSEQSKILTALGCKYAQRVFLTHPPTYDESIECEDPSRGYHLV